MNAAALAEKHVEWPLWQSFNNSGPHPPPSITLATVCTRPSRVHALQWRRFILVSDDARTRQGPRFKETRGRKLCVTRAGLSAGVLGVASVKDPVNQPASPPTAEAGHALVDATFYDQRERATARPRSLPVRFGDDYTTWRTGTTRQEA